MPTDVSDKLKGLNDLLSSTGTESSQCVSPPILRHPLIPAGCRQWPLGMEHIESGSSQFASCIDGNGPFVPQPLPADAIPQVVVSDRCHGLTNEMLMDDKYLESCGTYQSPVIAPVNYLAAPYNNFPTQCHETSAVPIVGTVFGSEFGSEFAALLPSTSCPPCDVTDEMTASRMRRERQADARRIPRPLTYGYNSGIKQKYTCIWSRGGAHSWTEALSGIMWVAVHGMDSICVVTRIKDLEHELTLRIAMLNGKPEILLCIFRNGLIGKVEDFVDPSSIPRRLLHQIIKMPFGVVSVIPDTKIVRTVSDHKALSAKYDEENAIKFLQNEMESGVVFTYDKTVQTAICALDHLFRHEFKANEIQLFVWKKDGGQAKALPHIRDDLDIEEHLAAMNKPGSCVREELDTEEHLIGPINKPDRCVW